MSWWYPFQFLNSKRVPLLEPPKKMRRVSAVVSQPLWISMELLAQKWITSWQHKMFQSPETHSPTSKRTKYQWNEMRRREQKAWRKTDFQRDKARARAHILKPRVQIFATRVRKLTLGRWFRLRVIKSLSLNPKSLHLLVMILFHSLMDQEIKLKVNSSITKLVKNLEKSISETLMRLSTTKLVFYQGQLQQTQCLVSNLLAWNQPCRRKTLETLLLAWPPQATIFFRKKFRLKGTFLLSNKLIGQKSYPNQLKIYPKTTQ